MTSVLLTVRLEAAACLLRGCCGAGCCSCRQHQPDYWAVSGSWFAIEKGQLVCLLGPNGAGKTTTINMLTGVIAASGGDAVIYGAQAQPAAHQQLQTLKTSILHAVWHWQQCTS